MGLTILEKIPVRALWLLWPEKRRSFNKLEVAIITEMSDKGLSRAMKLMRITPERVAGRSLSFSREQIAALRRPKSQLNRLAETHFSLTDAAKAAGLEPCSLSDLISKGLVPVVRSEFGDRVFLTPEVVKLLLHERKKTVSVSEAARIAGVSRAAVNRAIKAGRIKAVPLRTSRKTTVGIPRPEVDKIPEVVQSKFLPKSSPKRTTSRY